MVSVCGVPESGSTSAGKGHSPGDGVELPAEPRQGKQLNLKTGWY